MHIIFILAFGWDPRNLKQLKDPRRELEVSQKIILNLFQIWRKDQFDFNIFYPIISNIKNKWEKIIWLLKIKRNIGERILKSKYDFIGILVAILLELENIAFLKIVFLGQKNVHFVLNILFRRWKLILAFFDFFLYFIRNFFFGRNY